MARRWNTPNVINTTAAPPPAMMKNTFWILDSWIQNVGSATASPNAPMTMHGTSNALRGTIDTRIEQQIIR